MVEYLIKRDWPSRFSGLGLLGSFLRVCGIHLMSIEEYKIVDAASMQGAYQKVYEKGYDVKIIREATNRDKVAMSV